MTALGEELGPLRYLQGTWEGDDGLDVAFSNEEGTVIETPFREKTTFNPFGPVDNGTQQLFGLDYRTAAWRGDEENPFHTEVGYWLWDAADGTIMRTFMVPRGVLVLAGGQASPDAKVFKMTAKVGSETFGILSNPFLADAARTTRYEVTVTIGDGTFTYDETSVIDHARLDSELFHTDRNTLRKIAEPGELGEVSKHRE